MRGRALDRSGRAQVCPSSLDGLTVAFPGNSSVTLRNSAEAVETADAYFVVVYELDKGFHQAVHGDTFTAIFGTSNIALQVTANGVEQVRDVSPKQPPPFGGSFT